MPVLKCGHWEKRTTSSNPRQSNIYFSLEASPEEEIICFGETYIIHDVYTQITVHTESLKFLTAPMTINSSKRHLSSTASLALINVDFLDE